MNVIHGHQNLFARHSGKILSIHSAVKTNNDFELITWLMIQSPQGAKA